MARDDDGKRVGRQSRTYRLGGIGVTQMPGDAQVGADPSPGNSVFGPQDLFMRLTPS